MKAAEYVWIRRWGKLMGSYDYYISDQQRDAAAEGAPATATFRDHDTQTWRTVEEVTNPSTLTRLQAFSDPEGVEKLKRLHEALTKDD